MDSPRVTVVIPTYNRAELLSQSIQSVLAQTYSDFEVLISDNASTDNTEEVVASFGDPRIRYHRHAENIGLQRNYRFVLMHPTTEFVAYLSDDDLYQPEMLETAVGTLDRYPQAAYFACAAQFFGDDTKRTLRPLSITDCDTPFIYMPPSSAALFLGLDSPGPMAVCRRSVLHSGINWPKPDYVPGDIVLLPQLMTQGGFVFSNLPLYRFRAHGGNASHSPGQAKTMLRLNVMVWYGVHWLVQFLLDKRLCTPEDIERHGLESVSEQHVVPLVLGLSAFDSPQQLRSIARRVFSQRRDMDGLSSRFRLARRFGYWVLPASVEYSKWKSGWRP